MKDLSTYISEGFFKNVTPEAEDEIFLAAAEAWAAGEDTNYELLDVDKSDIHCELLGR